MIRQRTQQKTRQETRQDTRQDTRQIVKQEAMHNKRKDAKKGQNTVDTRQSSTRDRRNKAQDIKT